MISRRNAAFIREAVEYKRRLASRAIAEPVPKPTRIPKTAFGVDGESVISQFFRAIWGAGWRAVAAVMLAAVAFFVLIYAFSAGYWLFEWLLPKQILTFFFPIA